MSEWVMQSGQGIVKITGRRRRLAARTAGHLLDIFYPPVCLSCDQPVGAPDTLCAACWTKLRPITPPFCPRLGLPFAVDMGPDALSAEAIADPPPFDRARSAFIYDDHVGALISRLKYGDRPELARFFARAMFLAGRELFAEKAVLVPVPLHSRRQFRRRYNQSTELGRELAALSGLEVAPLLVRRIKPTRQQVGLSAEQRARNVQGVFAVDRAQAARWAGRPLVLVDDVITTGATIKSLTRALKRAGFTQIDVLSAARVVIGADMPI